MACASLEEFKCKEFGWILDDLQHDQPIPEHILCLLDFLAAKNVLHEFLVAELIDKDADDLVHLPDIRIQVFMVDYHFFQFPDCLALL